MYYVRHNIAHFNIKINYSSLNSAEFLISVARRNCLGIISIRVGGLY